MENCKKKATSKERSNYKCWSCGEKGYLANSKQCPNYKKAEEKEMNAIASWQKYKVSMYITVECAPQEYVINNAVNVTQKLEPTKVQLDKQADISIVHLMVLCDFQQVGKKT